MKKFNNCESFVPLAGCRVWTLKLLKISILLLFVTFSGNQVLAGQVTGTNSTQAEQQKKSVKGKVTDESGESIPGVSVLVKGTNAGTITDIDGRYVLEVPAGGNTLAFSFVGMKAMEVAIEDKAEINVSMVSETIGVDEVVVTALGIQRDKKTLTYSSQQVTGDEMLKAKDINFMNSLSGKTAGLEIKKSVSGAGGSTKTVLRGNKSLSQSSDPLYVIDGIPMVNRKGEQSGMWGGTDEGDGLSQINPEDIESISILKGSNAAVLYGSQGANGVIMINTKKGKLEKPVLVLAQVLFSKVLLQHPNCNSTMVAKAGQKKAGQVPKETMQATM